MVGEIRDRETAEIAIQAALTGHLVFSTLHTNDAPSSLTRLLDMKVEPFLISSSVIGILAQRLVRIICDKCKQKYKPDKSVLKDLGITKSSVEFYRGKGCSRCKNTGYIGRTGIFELFSLDENIRKMVNDKASADQIREKLIEKGARTLKDDGVEKILAGITTPQEVLRVTREE
jgi:type II secretory ATPase GspE/PulE/Tfp pilus assembly ATPase PilB-like protein